jgi:hypothetical protein
MLNLHHISFSPGESLFLYYLEEFKLSCSLRASGNKCVVKGEYVEFESFVDMFPRFTAVAFLR